MSRATLERHKHSHKEYGGANDAEQRRANPMSAHRIKCAHNRPAEREADWIRKQRECIANAKVKSSACEDC